MEFMFGVLVMLLQCCTVDMQCSSVHLGRGVGGFVFCGPHWHCPDKDPAARLAIQ
jgi:hypothetical protein